MSKILCLSDAMDDINLFTEEHELFLFKVNQLSPKEHSFDNFEKLYDILSKQIDLSNIDLIIAEYIESLPILYLIRKNGFYCPAIMIPHTNPYPLNILFYFILISTLFHPDDVILCGSKNAKIAFEKTLGISSKNICTFGIKSSFKPIDKTVCRKELGLTLDGCYILYTGRVMNDKGLKELVDAIEIIRKKIVKNVTLIISTTHIDSYYYNDFAAKLANTIIFYRMERSKLVKLYNAVDLYASCATSIFETYGKSQLEAIACGIPVIVPYWDGFPYYIDGKNGKLANINYLNEPINNPFQYSKVDIDDFVEKCCKALTTKKIKTPINLPNWALYDNTVKSITNLINGILKKNTQRSINYSNNIPISLDKLSNSAIKCLKHYGIKTLSQLVIDAEKKGLIDRKNTGDPKLLRLLHNDIFNSMDKVKEKILEDESSRKSLRLS